MNVTVVLNPAAIEQGVNISAAMNDAVQAVANAARRYAPVDTGELKNSIDSDVSGSTISNCKGRVFATARHAAFVEFGTSRSPMQPYLRPALSAI